jgi:O-methyltransferase
MPVSRLVPKILNKFGWDASPSVLRLDASIEVEKAELLRDVAPFTMTSTERLLAACDAVEYVVANSIEGAIVECGVWAGGTSMAMAKTLLRLGSRDRHMFLFDTFAGMPEPSAADIDRSGRAAAEVLRGDPTARCIASLSEVKINLASTEYPDDKLHLVRGRVEETLPESAPERIAVLRLDTDWYESTRHELEHLVPRMTPGGVLLIDDYGHWDGSRRAVDEWVASCGFPVFLARTDYTGRSVVVWPR